MNSIYKAISNSEINDIQSRFISYKLELNKVENEQICDTSPSFNSISSLDISYNSFRITGSINTSDCDENFISQGIVYSTSELPKLLTKKKYFQKMILDLLR